MSQYLIFIMMVQVVFRYIKKGGSVKCIIYKKVNTIAQLIDLIDKLLLIIDWQLEYQ